jgi:hypothetical protein
VTVAAPLDGSGPPVFARSGAVIPLAPQHDTLVATEPGSGLTTWTGDLIIRVMPSGPAGARESSFTLYDGTHLKWTGNALEVSGNPKPRSIELRTPDGQVVVQQLGGATATITP